MLRTINELRVRDPFIITDKEEGCYYLLVNNGAGRLDGNPSEGIDTYRSFDLIHFEGPYPAWRPPEDYYCPNVNRGAPEAHEYKGKWYIFDHIPGTKVGWETGAFPKDTVMGPQIFRAEKATGPYEVWSDGPITPWDMVALDGTLFVDKQDQPWMVYCHEWVQLGDGTVEAIRLSDDLKKAVGDPVHMFNGSDAAWSLGTFATGSAFDYLFRGRRIYITDGPFMFYDRSGALCTLWSTWCDDIYTTGVARSETGRLEGPWTHDDEPIYDNDGGHGMLFKTLEGRDMITFHQPNNAPLGLERMMILPAEITNHGLRIIKSVLG